MSKSLEDRLAQIGEEAEAGEEDQTVKPIPEHVKVTRGNPRSKVLQVRLNPDELDALEAIAARRDLPVSTIAREHLLKLIADDHSAVEDRLLQLIHAATRVQALADDVREDLLDRLSVIDRKGVTPSLKMLIDALALEPDIR
jgi:hypothetical protein